MAREGIWEGKRHGRDFDFRYSAGSNRGHMAREGVWWVDDKRGIRVSQRWGLKWQVYGQRGNMVRLKGRDLGSTYFGESYGEQMARKVWLGR